MPTKLQLVNAALSELGRLPVQAINDSTDAQYLSAKIDFLYPQVLQDCAWKWAFIYREDNTPLTTNFSPDYVYSYQLPGDFGLFVRFAATGSDWPVYAFMDGMLLAQTKPVQYYYISNQASYEVLPPLVSDLLILYAASRSSLTLTQNVNLTGYLQKEYEKARVKAILESNMQGPIGTAPYNDFDRTTFV